MKTLHCCLLRLRLPSPRALVVRLTYYLPLDRRRLSCLRLDTTLWADSWQVFKCKIDDREDREEAKAVVVVCQIQAEKLDGIRVRSGRT